MTGDGNVQEKRATTDRGLFTALPTPRLRLLSDERRLAPSDCHRPSAANLSTALSDSRKIDDSSPRAAWARLKMHEVMRANFSTPPPPHPPPRHLSDPSHFLRLCSQASATSKSPRWCQDG